MTSDQFSPHPKNKRSAAAFKYLRCRKSGLFSFARLRWLELFFWLAVMLVAGGICGGFIVAAIFRSHG